jgi:hypothetical protein
VSASVAHSERKLASAASFPISLRVFRIGVSLGKRQEKTYQHAAPASGSGTHSLTHRACILACFHPPVALSYQPFLSDRPLIEKFCRAAKNA